MTLAGGTDLAPGEGGAGAAEGVGPGSASGLTGRAGRDGGPPVDLRKARPDLRRCGCGEEGVFCEVGSAGAPVAVLGV